MEYDALLKENRSLQFCLNELASVMALPATWVGRELDWIANSLLDSLQGLIDPDLAGLRMNAPSNGFPAEWVRAQDGSRDAVGLLREASGGSIGEDLTIASFPLGLGGELGVLRVGSRRKPFPSETERLLLGVMANLAGVALLSARDLEERRQEEIDLQTQSGLLQGIAESIAAPVVFLKPNGEIEVINNNLLSFFGKTRTEMEGWQSSEIIHPDDRPATIEALKSAIATSEPYEVEARRRRVDGTYRWWRSNGYPMRDDTGAVVRWCVLYTDIHDRRIAEEALRQRELDFKLVVDSIPVPVAVTTPMGEVEGVNQATMDYFGKTFEELRQWKASELVHPEDLADTIAAQRAAHESGTTYNVQSRHRRHDGAYRWFNVIGVPLRDTGGTILRWMHLIIDIEDRKRAEQALAASEQKFEQIINTIPAMAWSANPDGTCDFFNQHHLDYVGRGLGEMTGIGFVSTFHPDDIDRLMGAWKVMLDSGRPGEVEGRIQRADGEYRWCLFRTNPLHDAEGRVTKWFGVNIDIEDRKRADEKLKASEFNLRQQTETIPQMLWSATPDGNIDYCNERLLEYSGLSSETVMNGGWVNLLHPDDREPTGKIWMRCIATGEPYNVEVRHFRIADQTYRWILTMALPLRDGDGRIIKWYGSCVDIHDKKQAEQALVASERRLQSIIDAIPALVWSAHSDGAADFANQYYLDYLGSKLDDVVGSGWSAAVHPDDLAGFIAEWQEIFESGQPGESQARLRRADGEYRWFLFRANPVVDDAGEVRWFGVNIDIEERKRADDALRASELNLRRQTETIPQMLWSALPNGSFDYCNTRFLDYTGSRSRGVMGDGWKHALHPEDQEKTARAWQHSVTTGEPYAVEVRKYCAAADEYHWCLTTALPLRDEDGRIIKWHGSSVDIHDRKLAEQALKASERQLAQIIDAIPAYVWSAHDDGGADFYNRHYRDYLGVPTEAVQDWSWTSIIHPSDLESHTRAWKQALDCGGAFDSQTRLRGSDGTYRWFLNRASALEGADGKVKWFGVTIDIEGMKRAEERLRASELNLRHLTETIPQNLFGAGADGLVNYLNPPLLEWFGRADENIMAEEWVHLVHPDDRNSTIAAWTSAVSAGTPYHHQVRFIHRDGEYRWCDVRARALRDESNTIIAWHGVLDDIHDQKLAEDALRANAHNLSQIINSIPGFTWTAQPDGTAEFLSKHYLDYVGMDFEEATGAGWTQAIHSEDVASLLSTWLSALDSGRSGEALARIRRLDGEYRWFLFRYSPFFDNDDRLVKWFGVNIDIEDRMRAEESLRASERNLRGLTESIPQMLWRTDPDGLVDYGNSRFLEYTGYSDEEVMGLGWLKILHPDDVERTKRIWHHSVTTGEPYHVEYRVRRAADNAYRWCLVTALPLRDEDGSIMKWHGCCIDVHDWKLAQEELRETQAELAHVTRMMTMGQLTASIAHELNQPLSGIMTNAGTGMRMLSAAAPNVQGALETVKRTMRDAQRASDVITRLRALFSRKSTEPEIVDLNAAAKEVIALASNELQRKGVVLNSHFHPKLPYLMGDRVQLQQVILNLILNGAEAMENVSGRPRELSISTGVDQSGDVRVSITDCGGGFDPQATEKMFSPFFTTKSSGMGIGLAVSRSIVEHHKGQLLAENNNGPGATFYFVVPSTLAERPVASGK